MEKRELRKTRNTTRKAIARYYPTARELVDKFNKLVADPINRAHVEAQKAKWMQQTRVEVVMVDILSPEQLKDRV